jgi:hypothetical protein
VNEASFGQSIPPRFIRDRFITSQITESIHPKANWGRFWQSFFTNNSIESEEGRFLAWRFSQGLMDAKTTDEIQYGLVTGRRKISREITVDVNGSAIITFNAGGYYMLLNGTYNSFSLCFRHDCVEYNNSVFNVSLPSQMRPCHEKPEEMFYILKSNVPIILDRRYITITSVFIANEIVSLEGGLLTINGSLEVSNITLDATNITRNIPITVFYYNNSINVSEITIRGIRSCEESSVMENKDERDNADGVLRGRSSLVVVVSTKKCTIEEETMWMYIGIGIAIFACLSIGFIVIIYFRVKSVREEIAPYHDRARHVISPMPKPKQQN